jgi:hypothetical protein
MREQTVRQDWRTVQLFLTKDYVAEVEVNSLNNIQIRCTCLNHSKLRGCNHVKYVKTHMMNNDGHYAIHIPEEVDEDVAQMAMTDSALFRQFIIDYGKVEVID